MHYLPQLHLTACFLKCFVSALYLLVIIYSLCHNHHNHEEEVTWKQNRGAREKSNEDEIKGQSHRLWSDCFPDWERHIIRNQMTEQAGMA